MSLLLCQASIDGLPPDATPRGARVERRLTEQQGKVEGEESYKNVILNNH